jgi:Kef-type K+ transport system membrane component KefB
MDKTRIVLDLFVMFASAKVLGEVCVRLKQPTVVGSLLAGVLLGPHVLEWIHPSEVYEAIAELGVIVLLFSVGLETKVRDLAEVGLPAVLVGTFGVLIPLGMGYGAMRWMGYGNVESLFIGTAILATSVGISARVLAEMGLIQHRVSRIVLGAAILDDILALMVLAGVKGMAKGKLDYAELTILSIEAILFVTFLVFVGTRLAERHGGLLGRLKIARAPFAFSLAFCLGLSVLAEYIGLAAIIGAFMAGIVLAELDERYLLEDKVQPVSDFLVPYFFVVMGTHVDLRAFLDPDTLMVILVVMLVAVASKIIGSLMGTFRMGLRIGLQTGVCMVPRGEVGIVVGLIGLGLGTMSEDVYTVVVSMSILTTLVAPPLIKVLFKGEAV